MTTKQGKPTPGPWTLGNALDCARNHAICAGPYVLAIVTGNGYPSGKGWAPDSQANATLMAASPDMLAALERCIDYVEMYAELQQEPRNGDCRSTLKAALAAIAKATGKAPQP